MSKASATVLFSGGIDSTACIHLLRRNGHQVGGLFVDFGQAAARMEHRSVVALSEHLTIPLDVLEIRNNAAFGAGELIGRNAFLVLAALLCRQMQSNLIAIGIHAGTSYFDCSPAFASHISSLVEECSASRASVIAPFLHWSKDDVYSYFLSTNVPLSLTYSCEASGPEPCQECASCKDRQRL